MWLIKYEEKRAKSTIRLGFLSMRGTPYSQFKIQSKCLIICYRWGACVVWCHVFLSIEIFAKYGGWVFREAIELDTIKQCVKPNNQYMEHTFLAQRLADNPTSLKNIITANPPSSFWDVQYRLLISCFFIFHLGQNLVPKPTSQVETFEWWRKRKLQRRPNAEWILCRNQWYSIEI